MSLRTTIGALSVCAFLLGPGAWAQEESDEAPPAAATEQPATSAVSPLQKGLQEISSLQSMLEFFFMEAGVYPTELGDLNAAFNFQLPKGARPVVVPKDPLTGEPFVYVPAANRKGYALRFPDPGKYGLAKDLELRPVSWGWLALRAERKRFEELAKLSKYHMETLATEIEMFAKDNQGAYPKTLDPLYPKYINRYPQDPITGKNYGYQQLADGYLISSPNPERYGLKMFQYSSSRGMLVEALSPTADQK